MNGSKKDKNQGISDLLLRTESLPHQTLYKLAEQLFDSNIIHKITDLSNDQTSDVMQFEIAVNLFFKRYAVCDFNRYDMILTRALEYRLSRNRLSREEIVRMFEALNSSQETNAQEVL